MNPKDLENMMALLEKNGWEPLPCDTLIPVVESPVRAGIPEEMGHLPIETVAMPRALLSMIEELLVKVKGDSMVDREIYDGDYAKLEVERSPKSNDIVIAAIGNEVTLKVFFEDENGIRWLVPQNKARRDKYKPIMLDGRSEDVMICGVVYDVLRHLPRVSNRDIANELKAAKEEMDVVVDIPQYRISSMIKSLAKKIKIGRLWYAVFRKMVDLVLINEKDYKGFCELVESEVPHHKHLPKPTEMQRMAVESFARPVNKWNEYSAPVVGSRFMDYKKIAEETERMLLRGDEFDD